MEKFDVSYRLEDEHRSLVAQLVPGQRPGLPWDRDSPVPDGTLRRSLITRLANPVPGLIAALTVRLHYADAGLRWRDGVFLRHPIAAYASEALFELRGGGTELSVEVRAPSPDLFFHVLRESVDHLISRRWPGLKPDPLVPCPTIQPGGRACAGRFRLDPLVTMRQRDNSSVNCQECGEVRDVAELLTGFALPAPGQARELDSIDQRLRQIQDELGRVNVGVRDLQVSAAENAHALRLMVALASLEITDCPRLFTLARIKPTGMTRVRVHQDHYRLTVWCEHPDHWHPLADATYSFYRPKEWLQSISRYAGPLLTALRHTVPVAGALAGVTLSPDQLAHAKSELELMRALLEELPDFPHKASGPAATAAGRPRPATGADLRAIRELLHELDHYKLYGGLTQVRVPSGEYLYICPQHMSGYDPGLPVIDGPARQAA
jgi:hypothetical protein